MCDQLKQWGIRLTLWIHPFVNLDSENGKISELREYFVKDLDGGLGIVEWWHGKAFVIDFTNYKAVQWFTKQLQSIKEAGLFLSNCLNPIASVLGTSCLGTHYKSSI